MSTATPGQLAKPLLALGVVLVLAPVGLWASTGAEGYTRWPNAKLRAADAEVSQEQTDLLADIGFEDESAKAEPEPEIESRFAFGLVPGGFDPKHLLSVAPLLSIGACSIGLALVLIRRGRKCNNGKESLA